MNKIKLYTLSALIVPFAMASNVPNYVEFYAQELDIVKSEMGAVSSNLWEKMDQLSLEEKTKLVEDVAEFITSADIIVSNTYEDDLQAGIWFASELLDGKDAEIEINKLYKNYNESLEIYAKYKDQLSVDQIGEMYVSSRSSFHIDDSSDFNELSDFVTMNKRLTGLDDEMIELFELSKEDIVDQMLPSSEIL
ncbi:hypothetical protein OAT84_02370 [Gammaproteobacteria bacterium]|nr:hypothetical protein [Gammaproteobacteria bacterium]